jgi:ubiquinone/menaquinone biosynthesis C-methylase UbiE
MTESASLTPRQQREIEYHRDYAKAKAEERLAPVEFDVTDDKKRRWWNAYWTAYTLLMRHNLKGLKVLAPGCGFGEDAARLARLGAAVEAFDISPEIIDIAKARAERNGYGNIRFSVSPCERLDFPDAHFDIVFFFDILHHVDIPKSVTEARRVLKPGGRIIGNELYTHSLLQKGVRESYVVDKVLYPAMKKFIYGKNDAYITEDERKIDEREIAVVMQACSSIELFYFNGLQGRLFPDRWPILSRADRLFMQASGPLGRVLAGRVVFDGVVAK